MKLAIGFILYNEFSSGYLPWFLPSLLAAVDFLAETDYTIYIFDNSSMANSANRCFVEEFRAQTLAAGTKLGTIKYQGLGQNLGFSRAYNILIDQAVSDEAEYFLALNPDLWLEPESIKHLLQALETDGSLGSAAPKLRRWDFANQVKTQQLDSVGIALLPGLRFIDLGQGQIDQGQFDEAKILGPSGAAALFRVAALTKIAESQSDSNQQEYFDERFFMYKEDCDLIYRLFLAGYGSIMVPQAIMYHDRTAAASGRGFWRRFSDRSHKNQQIRAWSFRNQHLLYFKHWKSQNIVNRLRIGWSMSGMFIFSLILEQFLLKEYRNFGWSKKGLTNIK